MTQTPLPFLLGQQGPYNISYEDTTSPTNTLFFGEFVSSWDVESPVARMLREAGPGCTWVVRPQSQPFSQWGVWGKPQSSEPRTESCRPSSCTIYKYIDCRKRNLSEETVHCALQSRVVWPLRTSGHAERARQERPGVTLESGGPSAKSGELRAPCCQPGQALRVGSAQWPQGQDWGH